MQMETTMEAIRHLSTHGSDWKELYEAAVFEDDNAKIPQRIAEAERALAARALELFGTTEHEVREQQAMENAMYFLRLLRKTDQWVNSLSESPRRTTCLVQQLG
jgi:hypothetical protein